MNSETMWLSSSVSGDRSSVFSFLFFVKDKENVFSWITVTDMVRSTIKIENFKGFKMSEPYTGIPRETSMLKLSTRQKSEPTTNFSKLQTEQPSLNQRPWEREDHVSHTR